MFGKKFRSKKEDTMNNNMESSPSTPTSTKPTTTSTTTMSTSTADAKTKTTNKATRREKCERYVGEGYDASSSSSVCVEEEEEGETKQQQQQQQHSKKLKPRKTQNEPNNNNNNDDAEEDESLSTDAIYDFYRNEIFPAIMSSFPILMYRLANDSKEWLKVTSNKALDFLLPAWSEANRQRWSAPSNFLQLLEETLQNQTQNSAIVDFMLHHFDTNGDGTISPSELINMTEIVSRLQVAPPQPQTFWAWFSREWPLMDWKIGVFLWRSFGGLLLVIAFLSVVPGRLHSISGKILRWPILGLVYFLIFVELVVYIVIRLVIRLAEILIATPKHRALRRKMARAECYEDWYKYAAALDISQKRDKWQRTVNDHTSYRYNWALIRQLREDMQHARDSRDSLLALAVLQQCTRKNVGGIMSEDLFSYTNTGEPKFIVKDFIEEVVNTLHWITDEAKKTPEVTVGSEAEAKLSYEKSLERKVRSEKNKVWKSLLTWATLSFHEGAPSENPPVVPPQQSIERTRSDSSSHGSAAIPRALPRFHKEQLIEFLKRARAAYGRTALCLSGGAMMGLYHFGHLQGLMETDCLPNIISGTSAGAVVGSIVATRTDEELRRDMVPEVLGPKLKCFSRSWPDRMKSLWKNGHLFSNEEWLDMIKWFTCGDLTFDEAYKKTGRIFCITLASTTKKAPPVLMNYISAPNVTIASAVIASAAVPGFIQPVRLQVKGPDGVIRCAGTETYFDGSIETDIPVNGLAEMLNCQFLVACQCNPHVVPFFFNGKGGVGRPSRWSSGEQEASWRGGFALSSLEMYLKNDMRSKFVFLRDVEAAVGFTSTMMTQEFVGTTTIVPQVEFRDFFKLFSDPDPATLKRYFQAGSVAAYQHAAMIRLHYRIADAIDNCLEKLGAGERRRKNNTTKVKASRRASFEINEKISKVVEHAHHHHHNSSSSPINNKNNNINYNNLHSGMPDVVTAALNERFETDSTSMSDDSYY